MNLDDISRFEELDPGGMLAEIDGLPDQLEEVMLGQTGASHILYAPKTPMRTYEMSFGKWALHRCSAHPWVTATPTNSTKCCAMTRQQLT